MKIHVPIILAGLALGGCLDNSNNPSLNVVSTNSTYNLEKISQGQEMPKNLLDIGKYLNEKIIYRPDKKNFWNGPKKTIDEGFGDCDDIAILGSYFAEKLGYSPKVLFLLENTRSAHLVTLLEENEGNDKKYGAIEHHILYCPVYSSINALVKDINRINFGSYFYYSVIDLNSLNKDWRTNYKNLIFPEKPQYFKLIPIDPKKKIGGCSVGKLNFESK